ncbi:MAG: ABC transporter permease subunit [Clostridia bacterium]|nr:ABC transporter permease subunit [Clostridia bacterium]
MTVSGMQAKKLKPALAAGSVVFWIAVWHFGASAINRSLILKIPLPYETLLEFLLECKTLSFWHTVLVSVLHILAGFLAGALLGVLFGFLSEKYYLFRVFSSPVHRLVKTVPVAALIILAWLWIPSSVLPSVISFLMVLPIVWSHTSSGIAAIDEKLVEMARVYSKTDREIFFEVKLALVSPFLRTGCITALSIAWKSGVAAEVISSPTGSLGALLNGAKTSINYPQVFAVTLTVVLLSAALEGILKLLWKEQKR